MSRSVSFRDLRLTPTLEQFNEIDMLNIYKDDVMKGVLAACAFDVNQPVLYVPSQHRDMQGKVAVGFVAVGEISLKAEFRMNGMLNMTERLVAAGRRDVSLAKEMAELSGLSRNYTPTECDDDETDGLADDQLEPDWLFVENQIKVLTELRDFIRGPCFTAAGGLKTYSDYAEYAESVGTYREKYDY